MKVTLIYKSQLHLRNNNNTHIAHTFKFYVENETNKKLKQLIRSIKIYVFPANCYYEQCDTI